MADLRELLSAEGVCGGQDNSETAYLKQMKSIGPNSILNKLVSERRKLMYVACKQNGDRLKKKSFFGL